MHYPPELIHIVSHLQLVGPRSGCTKKECAITAIFLDTTLLALDVGMKTKGGANKGSLWQNVH